MFRSIVSAIFLAGAATVVSAQETRPTIEVVKQSSCGCCGGWVTRMEEAGFSVKVRDVDYDTLLATKQAAGLGEETWACHTARVDGYVVEGHVPVREVERLLRERPDAIGIATPGMPMGAPGMDFGNMREAYDVVLIQRDGSTRVYASYPGN